MTETQAPTATDAEFELLVEASKQYEAYLKASEIASLLRDTEVVGPRPYADWDHPIGLVINGTR